MRWCSKDQSIGPNAQRERDHHNSGDAWLLLQKTGGIEKILCKDAHMEPQSAAVRVAIQPICAKENVYTLLRDDGQFDVLVAAFGETNLQAAILVETENIGILPDAFPSRFPGAKTL